jgi:hypothetical protein
MTIIDVSGVALSTSSSAKIARTKTEELKKKNFFFFLTILLNIPKNCSTIITT